MTTFLDTNRHSPAPPRRGTCGALCLLLAAIAAAGCAGDRTPRELPDVIVIVADTLRADRLGIYGNRRGLTPFLDELAARGTTFANAYAPSSWTIPSIASLFTARYPSQHGVNTYESVLPDDEVTFAEVLAVQRYAAKAFTANFRINSGLGYGQGFTEMRSYLPHGDNAPPKARADELRRDSLAWLEALGKQRARRPALLYLQYMEPHVPYVPPEPYLSRLRQGAGDPAAVNAKLVEMRYSKLSDDEVTLLASLYDAEVAALDADLRQLFAGLERLGRLQNAVVVITSDHGEEFREHGLMTHGLTLFEESIRIPLIVLGPEVAAGRTVTDPVTLLDVAPTILALAGLPAPARFAGQSLAPLLAERSWLDPRRWLDPAGAPAAPPRDVFCELEPEGGEFDVRRHSHALIRPPLKLVIGRAPEKLAELVPDPANPAYWLSGPLVYDLKADPGEVRPRPSAEVAQGAALVTALDQIRGSTRAAANPAPATQELDEATKEKLRALGYGVKP